MPCFTYGMPRRMSKMHLQPQPGRRMRPVYWLIAADPTPAPQQGRKLVVQPFHGDLGVEAPELPPFDGARSACRESTKFTTIEGPSAGADLQFTPVAWQTLLGPAHENESQMVAVFCIRETDLVNGDDGVSAAGSKQRAVGVPRHGVDAARTRRCQHACRAAPVRQRVSARPPQPHHLRGEIVIAC